MKLKICILFILLGLSNLGFTKSSKTGIAITKKQIKSMSFTRLQVLRSSYIKFFTEVERDFPQVQSYSPEARQTSQTQAIKKFEYYFSYIQKFYMAHAGLENGKVCFFGGWPSRISGGLCQAPWKNSNDSDLENKFGGVYKNNFCNASGGDQFRCNPLLFGKGHGSDGKGPCVKMGGTYNDLTNKCKATITDASELANLVNEWKKDPKKQEQIKALSTAAAQFCKDYEESHKATGKKYDACEALEERTKALLDPKNNGHEPVGENTPDTTKLDPVQAGGVANTPKVSEHSKKSLALLNSCEQHLVANSSDDVNNRGILQSLQGGMSFCNNNENLDILDKSLDYSNLQEVSEKFEKLGYLRDLNIKSFEYSLRALLNNEIGFMHDVKEDKLPIHDKAKLLEILTKKFPKLGSTSGAPFEAAFDKVYSDVMAQEKAGKIPKVNSIDAIDDFKGFVNGTVKGEPDGVNEFCKKLNTDYDHQFGDLRKGWRPEWSRSYTEKEKTFIEQSKRALNHKINDSFEKSKIGFMLGTEHFRENIMDPTVDLTHECLEDPNFKPINPEIGPKDYKKALSQVRDKILEGISELTDKEAPFNLADKSDQQDDADDLIEDYLRENKVIVTDDLMYSDAEGHLEKTKYLCNKITDVYDVDENWQVVSWVGAGVSVVGGVACAFPLTAPVGCPAMWGGTAVAGISGGAKMYAGSNLENSAMLNQIVQNNKASEFTEAYKIGNDEFNSGAMELGGALVAPTLHLTAKGYSVAKAAYNVKKYGVGTYIPAGAKNITPGANLKQLNGPAPADDLVVIAGPKVEAPLGQVKVKYKNHANGEVRTRLVSTEAMANGKLSDIDRVEAIFKEFGTKLGNQANATNPNQVNKMVRSIFDAHKKIPCNIGKCTIDQLKQKLRMMKDAGVSPKVAREAIRRGFTGGADDTLEAVITKNRAFFGSFPEEQISNVQFTRAIPTDSGNGAWVSAIGEAAKKDPYLLVKVAKSNGDEVEVFARYMGTDGKKIFMEGANGRFVLDPKNSDMAVKSIRHMGGTIDEGVYKYSKLTSFETNPQVALKSSTGHKDMLVKVLDEDGDEFTLAGKIIAQQEDAGNGVKKTVYYMETKNKYSGSTNLVKIEDEGRTIAAIEKSYTKANWTPKTHTRELEEAFPTNTPVTINHQFVDKWSKVTDEVVGFEGKYVGIVNTKVKNGADIKEVVIRQANGNLKYVPVDHIENISSVEGTSILFNGGAL